MGKYDALENYLKNLPASTKELVLTSEQIEKIITPYKLSEGAWKHLQNWDYRPPGIALSKAWNNAGFQVVMVDLEHKQVRFKRK